MANSRIRQVLTALPAREVRQIHPRELTSPDVYAFSSVLAPSNSTTGAGSSTLTLLLQTTLKETSDAVAEANKQLASLLPVQQRNLDTVNQNTQALVNNTASKGGSGSSALSTVGNIASTVFGSGSILTPIITGLINLFRAPSTPQPVFTAFTMPAPIHLDTTLGGGSPQAAQQTVRAAASTEANVRASVQMSAPPIQIQVNAIDSRSFLDHSDQIAQAVRQALLNSHPLADVIAEI